MYTQYSIKDVKRLPDAVERIQKCYLGQVMCVSVSRNDLLCCSQSEHAIMQTSPNFMNQHCTTKNA